MHKTLLLRSFMSHITVPVFFLLLQITFVRPLVLCWLLVRHALGCLWLCVDPTQILRSQGKMADPPLPSPLRDWI